MALHKRTGGSIVVTKNLIKDVWLLFAPANQQKDISDILGMMQVELQMISTQMRGSPTLNNKYLESSFKGGNECVQLDAMLLEMYAQRQIEGNPICAPIMRVKDQILEGAAATRRNNSKVKSKNVHQINKSRSLSPQAGNTLNKASPKSPMSPFSKTSPKSPMSPTIDTKMVGNVLKEKISGTLKLQKLVPQGVGNIKPPGIYIP